MLKLLANALFRKRFNVADLIVGACVAVGGTRNDIASFVVTVVILVIGFAILRAIIGNGEEK